MGRLNWMGGASPYRADVEAEDGLGGTYSVAHDENASGRMLKTVHVWYRKNRTDEAW